MSIKKVIKEILENQKEEYSHVIIYFDGEYHYRYVLDEEDIFDVLESVKEIGSIKAVYNYSLDIAKQLEEENPMHISEEDIEGKIFDSALKFAYKKHKGQKRRDGTEYINHPIRVANYITKFVKSDKLDVLRMAAYLHDTLEDTDTTYEELKNTYGEEVADIVLELTNNKEIQNKFGKTECLKMGIKNMSSDALIVKLCDRLDNVSDLATSSIEFRNRYLKQTLELIEFMFSNKELNATHIAIIREILMSLSATIHTCYSATGEALSIEGKPLTPEIAASFHGITLNLALNYIN